MTLKRKRTVKYDDIKDLGLKLNMRFRLKNLKLEDIINKVINLAI
jgi:hypothetical protein